MAWIDDRIWCHPKLADLSDRSFRVYINSIAYSSGFSTAGQLTTGQQRMIGGDTKTRRDLIAAGLWDDTDSGTVSVHDWDVHNAKRDARRAADRERKKEARAAIDSSLLSAGTSAGQSADNVRTKLRTNVRTSAGTAHVEGSEGSDGSEEKPLPHNVVTSPAFALPQGRDTLKTKLDELVLACGNGHDALLKIKRASKGCAEGDVVHALEACRGPGVRDRLAVALAELKKRREHAA